MSDPPSDVAEPKRQASKRSSGKLESEILNEIRSALARADGVVCWRNNVGFQVHEETSKHRRRAISYGLAPGSADLVGIVAVHSCDLCHYDPDHCRTWGRFFSLEIKTVKGRASDDQVRWGAVVRQMGGFYAVVRSADEAVAAVDRCRRGLSE